MACFLAVFGYAVAPDNSPNGNTHLPAIAQAPAGARVWLLALKRDAPADMPPFWKRLFWGTPLPYQPVVIENGSLCVDGDSVRATAVLPLGAQSAAWPRNALWNPNKPLVHRVLPLGADAYGRCIFSRLILGFRVSMAIGFLAVAVALVIGVLLGAAGGYFGGAVDAWVMLLINTMWSIPTLLMVFAVVMALGRHVGVIFLAVGLTLWVDVARVVRGQMIALRARPFTEAAYNLGLPPTQIIWRHLLPNLTGPLMVVLASSFATAILLECGLSYLGFGVQPPAPSWGSLLNENYGAALSGRWVAALAPAGTIAATVWAFYTVGQALADKP